MTKLLAAASLVIGLLASSNAIFASQQTVTLAVENMVCEACPYMVKKNSAGSFGRRRGHRLV